jgi:hypothetical protein
MSMRLVRHQPTHRPDRGVAIPVNLGALRKLTDGDTERQREMIIQFIECADRALRGIERGLADNDLSAVVLGADLLQRASLQAQATPTLQAALSLQRAARSRQADVVRNLAGDVRQEVARAVEFTRAWAT